MSLHWRIANAFALLIALSVSLTVSIGYFTSQSQFDLFVAELGRIEANNLAQNLSEVYTANGKEWNFVKIALAREVGAFPGVDRVRVVIIDSPGRVIIDNFGELPGNTLAPPLSGIPVAIRDLETNRQVGTAYVDVNQSFLATESRGFFDDLLYRPAGGGLFIIGLAFVLALWLSRRITASVTALQATQS